MTEPNYELAYNNLKIKYDNMTSKFNEYITMYKKSMDMVDNQLNQIQKEEDDLNKKISAVESFCEEKEIKEEDIKPLKQYSNLELYRRLIMLTEMEDSIRSKIFNVNCELKSRYKDHKECDLYLSSKSSDAEYTDYIDYLEEQIEKLKDNHERD